MSEQHVLSVAEIKWGLIPGMAGWVLLTQLAPADVVRELVFSGGVVSGRESVAFTSPSQTCLVL